MEHVEKLDVYYARESWSRTFVERYTDSSSSRCRS